MSDRDFPRRAVSNIGPLPPTPPAGQKELTGSLISAKIQDWHRHKKAIVYVRQSTGQQVSEHPESTERQYALVDRAIALGWPRERVEVIDEDLGKSGQTAQGRLGFQRLLAEVGLDQIGLIVGLEMSRLARSCTDWHQLLELCAVFGTLLADPDGLYDPTDYNDRLLLGLTGIIAKPNCIFCVAACWRACTTKPGGVRYLTCRLCGGAGLPTIPGGRTRKPLSGPRVGTALGRSLAGAAAAPGGVPAASPRASAGVDGGRA
jgi:hypothetical protein